MEGEVITMQEIFRFRQTGVSADGIVQGRFEATGIRPRFLDQVMAHGDHAFGRPVPARREVRRMNAAWLRALVLVCVFGAVVLAVEVLVAAGRRSRAEGKAINLRLKMIGRGRNRGETMNILRRADELRCPRACRRSLAAIGARFERMLMQAQVTMPTGRLMLLILLAPVVDLLRACCC